jgi:hypothetical protein
MLCVGETLPIENSSKVSVDLRCGLCKKIFFLRTVSHKIRNSIVSYQNLTKNLSQLPRF